MPAEPGIELLRTHKNESGYRNVYVAAKSESGAWQFVAKVKIGGRLYTLSGSRGPDPRECARAVIRWYAATFGRDWPAALAARKRLPYRAWFSRARGGWCVRLWLRGRPVELTNADGELAVLLSHRAALEAADQFALKLTGHPLRRNSQLWRTGLAPERDSWGKAVVARPVEQVPASCGILHS